MSDGLEVADLRTEGENCSAPEQSICIRGKDASSLSKRPGRMLSAVLDGC